MANPSPPEAWSATYEASPIADDGVGQGDDWLRQLKVDVRERSEVEHHFGSTNADDNGLHRVGSARAFIQATAPTVVEQADHDNTGGLGTATLSANGSNSSPAETVGLGRLWVRTVDGALHYYGASGWAEVAPMPRGHIAGLDLTVINSNDDVSIAPGEARTGTSSSRSLRNAVLSAAHVKQIDATWASGTNAGGMATGSVANNTWYHVFLIVSPTGTVDAGFDTSPEAVNLLANAAVIAAGFTAGNTTYRRIGSVKTEPASANILDFAQEGDCFTWVAPPAITSTASADQSGADKTQVLAPAPTGFAKVVETRVSVIFTGGSNNVLVVGNSETIGGNPSTTTSPIANFRYDSGTNQIEDMKNLSLMLDTTNTVKFRSSGANASQLHFQVVGWEDPRGRWD